MLNVSFSFVPPLGFPQCSFMKRCGQFQQPFANQIEKKPNHDDAQQALRGAHQTAKRPARQVRLPDKLRQARGADDPVVVFGDAFAAEKTAALRTTRHGFTRGVIETSLSGQALHGQFTRRPGPPQKFRRLAPDWRLGICATAPARRYPWSRFRQSRLSSS